MNEHVSTLFAKALQDSANDEVALNNLAFLLVLLRPDPDNPDQDAALLEPVAAKLGAETGALEEVQQRAAGPEEIAFQPVTAKTSAAAYLLAMLVILNRDLADTEAVRFVDESVKSQIPFAEVYNVAGAVTKHFQTPFDGIYWENIIVDSLLQMPVSKSKSSFDDPELVKAAAGNGSLPETWQQPSELVKRWLKRHMRRLARQSKVPAEDVWGIFSGRRRIDNELTFIQTENIHPQTIRPAVVHPLVLYLLRYEYLADLKAQADLPQALADWLVRNLYTRETVIRGATPECAFAAGALMLELADNLVIPDDGSAVTSSLKDSTDKKDPEDPVDKMLKAVIENSERRGNEFWRDKENPDEQYDQRVRRLLQECPDWYAAPLIDHLRARAQKQLKKVLPSKLPGLRLFDHEPDKTVDYDEFETAARWPLPERRPAWENGAAQASAYGRALAKMDRAEHLEKLNVKIQENANTLNNQMTILQAVLNSPLANNRLPNLISQEDLSKEEPSKEEPSEEGLTNWCPLVLQQKIGQMDLMWVRQGQDQPDKNQSLDTHEVWLNTMGAKPQGSNEILQAWASLEVWDALRGRLVHVAHPDDEKVQALLFGRPVFQQLMKDDALPDVANEDEALKLVGQVRPVLATVSLLGLPYENIAGGAGNGNKLMNRLDQLLDPVRYETFNVEFQRLVTAAKLEFGVTLVSVGIEPASVFPLETLTSLLEQQIKLALESPVAWESRAGMNAVILLARLADTTGDLSLAQTVTEFCKGNSRLRGLVGAALDLLKSPQSDANSSALPLALVACDLGRFARQKSLGIESKGLTEEPGWIEAGSSAGQVVNQLAEQFSSAPQSWWHNFAAEGGLAGRLLLLTILQIKLDELQRLRRVLVRPPNRQEVWPVVRLQRAVRGTLCRDQLVRGGLSAANVPWWQTAYWAQRAKSTVGTTGEKKASLEIASKDALNARNIDALPAAFKTQLGLTYDSRLYTRQQDEEWVIFINPDFKFDEEAERLKLADFKEDKDKGYLIKRGEEQLEAYELETPFHLVSWLPSYDGETSRLQGPAEAAILTLAAQLEAAVPLLPPDEETEKTIYSVQLLQDIDGKFADEFPVLSFAKAQEKLKKAIGTEEEHGLIQSEKRYEDALGDQEVVEQHSQLLELLKMPLRLSTADYREQLQAALAEVQAAEAELAAAEHEAVAWQFEQIASTLVYDSMRVEMKRQQAQLKITQLDQEIADLDKDDAVKNFDYEKIALEIGNLDEDKQEKVLKRATKEMQKALLAQQAIQEEINLVRKLLGDHAEKNEQEEMVVPPPSKEDYKVPVTLPDGTKLEANGQIRAIAEQVKFAVNTQLAKDLEAANAAVEEAERQARKARKRRFITSICRFVGAAVGAYFGNPALGAEIGGALGEAISGANEGKPPEEIFVGLMDNGFAIAQAAGYDPKAALNKIGGKAATEINDYFKEIEENLGPILDTLPTLVDEQTMQQAFELLDLEEVPQLSNMIKASYETLKGDIGNLENLGDIFFDEQTGDPIAFDTPNQLLGHMGDALFKQTKDNLELMKPMARAVGVQLEHLGTEKGKREVADRVVKMGLTQLSDLTVDFRRQTLQKWINAKREANKTWDEVKDEGEELLERLFPDPTARAEIITNIQPVLMNNKEQIRGAVQAGIQPWQEALDTKLNEIMKPKDAPSPPDDPVEAAKYHRDQLNNAKDKFENDLIPWMEGTNDDSKERTDLLNRLSELEQEHSHAELESDIRALGVEEAEIDLEKAKLEIDKLQIALGRAKIYLGKAELNVSKASWQNKVAQLGIDKTQTLQDAQENSTKAVEARRKAALAKVQAAEANLVGKQALADAAARRGAEASRIRATLSAPPLRHPNLAESNLAEARAEHAYQLERALAAYRELVRYQRAMGMTEHEIPKLERPDLLTPSGDVSKWSLALGHWLNAVGDFFGSDASPAPKIPGVSINWQLSPEQIAAITSPAGFRFVLVPDFDRQKPLFVMSLGVDPGKVDNIDRLWREFKLHGYSLSEPKNLRIKEVESNEQWILIDDQADQPVRVTVSKNLSWPLPNEVTSFRLKRQGGDLIVSGIYSEVPKSDIADPEVGRFTWPDLAMEALPEDAARSGRIVALFLRSTKINGDPIGESEYKIDVRHRGDNWKPNERLKFRLGKQTNYVKKGDDDDFLETTGLKGNRSDWLGKVLPTDDLRKRVQSLYNIDGDFDPAIIQGTPLSGTTVIRLFPVGGGAKFNNLTIEIIYKYYTH